MAIVLTILLTLLLLSSLILDWSLNVLPERELKRRAGGSDKSAKNIYSLYKYQNIARWLISIYGTVSAGVLIVWAALTSYWLGAAVVIIVSLLVLGRHRPKRTKGILWNLAGMLASVMVWKLQLFRIPSSNKTRGPHTKIYETEDLLDLIKRQAKQVDNRVAEHDLKTAHAALNFGSKTVGSIMRPMNEVRIVLPDESIGPHLMDELHATGYGAFPVGKKVGRKVPPQIEGTVYIKSLIDNPNKQNVSQIMNHDIAYIAEDQTLNQALEKLLTSRQFLLVVRSGKEDNSGVIWLEDILEHLLGRKVLPNPEIPADADEREKVVK